MPADQRAKPAALAFEGVQRTFGAGPGAAEALRGVTRSFREATFHAVLGPSGSGKSTLVHLAAGLDMPTGGRVLLQGHETSTLDEASLARLRRRSVGIVFQFFNLVPTLTVEENALLPVLLDRKPAREDLARLEELLERMDLVRLRHRLPEELSGGERQRAAIARALLPSPVLLLADEPTGSLDSAGAAAITRLLREEVERSGVCLVVTTHDPAVGDGADEVLFLRDGRIEEGAPAPAPRESGRRP